MMGGRGQGSGGGQGGGVGHWWIRTTGMHEAVAHGNVAYEAVAQEGEGAGRPETLKEGMGEPEP